MVVPQSHVRTEECVKNYGRTRGSNVTVHTASMLGGPVTQVNKQFKLKLSWKISGPSCSKLTT